MRLGKEILNKIKARKGSSKEHEKQERKMKAEKGNKMENVLKAGKGTSEENEGWERTLNRRE